MLAETFRFTALLIGMLSAAGAVVVFFLFLAFRSRASRSDVVLFVVLGVTIGILGAGVTLAGAWNEAQKYHKHQEQVLAAQLLHRENVLVTHALSLEGFAVRSVNFRAKTVTISFGTLRCIQTFALKIAYGDDPDGNKLRWRPALPSTIDNGWIGLVTKDLRSLKYACTR